MGRPAFHSFLNLGSIYAQETRDFREENLKGKAFVISGKPPAGPTREDTSHSQNIDDQNLSDMLKSDGKSEYR